MPFWTRDPSGPQRNHQTLHVFLAENMGWDPHSLAAACLRSLHFFIVFSFLVLPPHPSIRPPPPREHGLLHNWTRSTCLFFLNYYLPFVGSNRPHLAITEVPRSPDREIRLDLSHTGFSLTNLQNRRNNLSGHSISCSLYSKQRPPHQSKL